MDASTIQPGLQQIDDVDYHALPFCSKHALDVIAESSPMHLRYRREHPQEPTDAMRFGRAFHTAILEPLEFVRRHVVIGQCAATKKSGERCTYPGKLLFNDEWFCGTHAKDGALVVPDAIAAETNEQILHMCQAIRRHPAAAALMWSEGLNEQAAIWDRYVDGDGWRQRVRCKLKADAIRPMFGACVDVKTCESAAPEACQKAIGNLGYHRQGAWYLDGLAAVGHPVEHFVLLFVEKSAPYGVAAYRLQSDAIELGREQNERLLRIYANCERRGYWPGYEDEFRDISLTSGAFRAALAEV